LNQRSKIEEPQDDTPESFRLLFIL